MKSKAKAPKKTDPKVRTFFLLSFPSVVITTVAMLFPVDVKTAIIMMMLMVYQFLMLKQFVDQYHEVM